ncbi:MAG: hypothetical protein HC772_01690 [Leptolyngbyaceae cyanobacterium CRU_2_3]|nr:hypothetical protein [Leptolyngbyaceae cyanobacterium CRU_2_3]
MADRDNRLNGASSQSLPINRNDKLGKQDLDDLFKFSLTAKSSLTLRVSNIKRGANFDVEIYGFKPDTTIPAKVGRTEFRKLRASDRNRYLTLAGSSRKSGNKAEAIELSELSAGNYVIRVLQRQGDSRYRLTTNATVINDGTGGSGTGGTNTGGTDTGGSGTGGSGTGGTGTGGTTPGNTIQTAIDQTVPNTSITGTLSDADTQDFYKVTPTTAGDYLFDLSGTGGDANLEIIGADQSTVLKRGINAGNEKFILPLAAGTPYYFRVLQAGSGNTIGYALGVTQLSDTYAGKYDNGNGLGTATALNLATDQNLSNYVVDQGINSPEDLFSFNVSTAQAFVTLNLSNMPIGDLGLQIFKQGETPEQGLTRNFARNPDGSYPSEILAGRVTAGTLLHSRYSGCSRRRLYL